MISSVDVLNGRKVSGEGGKQVCHTAEEPYSDSYEELKVVKPINPTFTLNAHPCRGGD